MSREPEMSSRVQFPSIPELKDGFEEATKRIARNWKIKFRGRKLRPGPLGNAVLLHFMSLPEEKQAALAEAFLRRYESLLQFDEPVDDIKSVLADDGDPAKDRVVGLGGSVRKLRSKSKRDDKAADPN